MRPPPIATNRHQDSQPENDRHFETVKHLTSGHGNTCAK